MCPGFCLKCGITFWCEPWISRASGFFSANTFFTSTVAVFLPPTDFFVFKSKNKHTTTRYKAKNCKYTSHFLQIDCFLIALFMQILFPPFSVRILTGTYVCRTKRSTFLPTINVADMTSFLNNKLISPSKNESSLFNWATNATSRWLGFKQ